MANTDLEALKKQIDIELVDLLGEDRETLTPEDIDHHESDVFSDIWDSYICSSMDSMLDDMGLEDGSDEFERAHKELHQYYGEAFDREFIKLVPEAAKIKQSVSDEDEDEDDEDED
jgi:hypothetical protein